VSAASQSMRGGARIGPTLSARTVQIGILAAAALVVALVNAASTSVDLARHHVPVAPLEPLVWELTSWLGLLVALPPLIAADNALSSRRPVGVRVAVVVALATIFFGVHISAMIGSRDLIYWLGGGRYDFGPWGVGLVYEGRKDALTFAGALGGFWLWRAAVVQRWAPEAPAASDIEPAFIAESRKGRVVLRAPDIDWVEAQGNYVALHAGGESYLIRQPLKTIDAKLRDAAFVRTHRRALVNTRRVRAIHRTGGGLKVELANQEFAPLSDRHRAAVVKALAAG
jgi:hypothetical protein